MMKYILPGVAISLAVLIILTIIFSFYIYTPYEATSVKESTFYINEDFDTVRRVLVRAPTMKKMVELGHGTLIESKQEDIVVGFNRILDPNWMVEADGWFTVRHQNGYLEGQILTLRQHVIFTKDKMDSTISLTEPVGTLVAYDTFTHLERCGSRTKVKQRLVMTIHYKIVHTRNLKKIVESELDKAATESMWEQEHSLREVIKIYKDRRWFIPIGKEAA